LPNKFHKVFSGMKGPHDAGDGDNVEESKPLSPPRRAASRVRTLDQDQMAVAELILEHYEDNSEEDLFSTRRRSFAKEETVVKNSSGYGLKRFKSSPVDVSRRLFMADGLKRTASHDSSVPSSTSTSSLQRKGHAAQVVIDDDIDEDESPLYLEQRPRKTSNNKLRNILSSAFSSHGSTILEKAHVCVSNGDEDHITVTESDTSSVDAEARSKSTSSQCKKILVGVILLALLGGMGFAMTYSLYPRNSTKSSEEASISEVSESNLSEPNLSDDAYTFDDGTTKIKHPVPMQPSTKNNVASNKELVGPAAILNGTTSTINKTSVSFYVMADAPYTNYERTHIMPQQIADLNKTDSGGDPNAASFLVHLGDLQKATVDQCEEFAYREASGILKQSTLPVFVIPGDNDINDCEELEHGQAMWRQYYHKMDELWYHEFEILRWGDLDESFAFLHNGILFLGLNIIGGTPHSYSEWSIRHALHLSKVKEIMTAHDDDFSIAVLFGHAAPGTYHEDFFEGENGLAAFVKEMGKPFLHLHGDSHAWYENDGAFGVNNYLMVCLDAGENAPPIKVDLDTSKANPIKINRIASGLEVDCCSQGWPKLGTEYDDDRYNYDDDDDDDETL